MSNGDSIQAYHVQAALPAGATITERNGRKIAVWKDAKSGKARTAPLNGSESRKHPSGTMILVCKNTYDIAYCDDRGRRKWKAAGTSDKAIAERIAARLEDAKAQRRHGLIDPKADTYAKAGRKPLAEHLTDFKNDLTAKGNEPRHVQQTHRYASHVVLLAKANRISELVPSAIQAAIGTIRDGGSSLRTCMAREWAAKKVTAVERADRPEEIHPASLRTCNAYLRAIKQFSRWLVRDGRAATDPLAYLKGFNAAIDLKRERRALSDAELTWLIDTAESSSVLFDISGTDRAMAYRLASGTGRMNCEAQLLRVLTWTRTRQR